MGTIVGRVCVAGEKRAVSQASADLSSAVESVSGSDASDESVCCRSRRQLVPTWHGELGGRLQMSIEWSQTSSEQRRYLERAESLLLSYNPRGGFGDLALHSSRQCWQNRWFASDGRRFEGAEQILRLSVGGGKHEAMLQLPDLDAARGVVWLGTAERQTARTLSSRSPHFLSDGESHSRQLLLSSTTSIHLQYLAGCCCRHLLRHSFTKLAISPSPLCSPVGGARGPHGDASDPLLFNVLHVVFAVTLQHRCDLATIIHVQEQRCRLYRARVFDGLQTEIA